MIRTLLGGFRSAIDMFMGGWLVWGIDLAAFVRNPAVTPAASE